MYLTNVDQVIVVNNLLGKLKKKIALMSLFVHVACLFTPIQQRN